MRRLEVKVGGTGRLTYCHTAEECYSYELFVCREVLEDLAICREVDEDREGIFGYFLFEISLGFRRELEIDVPDSLAQEASGL